MNRFRTKKKSAKEANEAAERASHDTENPQIVPLKPSKTFRLGRKNVPVVEPKLEIDLSTALPSSDDFRTSLLMNGLSARFSMLREQDDPNSKIGKASDDSVLFPKRASRLDNLATFSPNGLADIEEVASIRSSNQIVRPQFARTEKTDSFQSNDGWDAMDDDAANGHGGSIMARRKPGEGNNLFGGRQKVYQIPVKSAADGGAGKGAGVFGRARYDDDVSLSAFQRFKERERQQQERDEEQARLAEEEAAAETVRSNSPPLSGYNRNRETSSTTSSGPSNIRSSTAATSIDYQGTAANVSHMAPGPGLERSATKGRRLYETGLEKNLHEQQHSAMSRIDSLSRQTMRAETPPLILASPTRLSNYERHERLAKPSQASLGAVSPPPSASAINTFEFAWRPTKPSSPPIAAAQYVAPPLSPPMSDGDDAWSSKLPIDARDRGKATALGTFHRPAHPYDETKYLERQMQLQARRDLPPKSRPYQHPPLHAGRSRAESHSTPDPSRFVQNPYESRQPFIPRKRIPEHRVPEPRILSPPPASPTASPGSPGRSRNFALEGSDRKPTAMRLAEERLTSSPESQGSSSYPGQRLDADCIEDDFQQDSANPFLHLPKAEPAKPKVQTPVDSPTLGPTIVGPTALSPPTTGLSGLVRQHLRSDSNASSSLSSSPKMSSKSHPWEAEGWGADRVDEQISSIAQLTGINRISALPSPLSLKSPPIRATSTDDEARPSPRSVRSPNMETFRTEEARSPASENVAPEHHKRDGSTEAQQESDTFTRELAQRRRRVQENLKSFAESDSGSNSPVPELNWQKELNRMKSNPLGILKPKSSRESMVGSIQVRSRRMLGLGNTTISSSQGPKKQMSSEEMWQREEQEMLRGFAKAPYAGSPTNDTRPPRREERQASDRNGGSESERSEHEAQNFAKQQTYVEAGQPREAQQNRPSHGYQRRHTGERLRQASQESKDSPSAGGPSRPSSRAARDRSSSATSGRSKSRNGTYRDDLAKAMAEGMSSLTTQASYEDAIASRPPVRTPDTPNLPSPPATFVSSPPKTSNGKARSNSRPSAPPAGHCDTQNLHAPQTGDIGNIGFSPRPSPVTPFSVNSTPSPTPTGPGTNAPSGQAQQGRTLARKKTVNKADISEPTLVSSTSNIDTVDLPTGASLKNCLEPAPPVPAINPRRRQTRIQTMVGVFSSRSTDSVPTVTPHSAYPTEDLSSFSGSEDEGKKPRKLRKSSSEGGNLRGRQVAPPQAGPSLPYSKDQGAMF